MTRLINKSIYISNRVLYWTYTVVWAITARKQSCSRYLPYKE